MLKPYIEDLRILPSKLRTEVEFLSEEQLNTKFRLNGWTLRQLIHHIGDSHLNSFIRIKLALTETNPVIKPYYGERWAELPDSKILPIEPTLKLIEAIHERWVIILEHLSKNDWLRTFYHPEYKKEFTILEQIETYAWHGNLELAHIKSLKKKKNW